MREVVGIIAVVIQVYSFVILGRVLMGWVPMFTGRPLDPGNPIVNVLLRVTEPVLAPVRRFTTFGMMDLSPTRRPADPHNPVARAGLLRLRG